MNAARCRWQEVVVAVVDFHINRFGHISADVFANAFRSIDSSLRLTILIVRVETHPDALHILDGKGLLQRCCESHTHAIMTEHDSWQAFGRLYAGDPEKLFEEVRSVRMLQNRYRLVNGLHVEQRLSCFSR